MRAHLLIGISIKSLPPCSAAAVVLTYRGAITTSPRAKPLSSPLTIPKSSFGPASICSAFNPQPNCFWSQGLSP
ncbi:hypothetical protein OE88DRAFT_1666218 [Heliocybe sulcata]|uniref:Secreted protein n=1 Tax=Heliocybe sulcata TaxID=5364 RepID=A0A5C3MRG4_9AGAM|nr:hypothetical protein OE88DRAFT_1666218 [Heliocybe sulcata]